MHLHGHFADVQIEGDLLVHASACHPILAIYERYADRPDVIRTVLIDLESYLVRRMVCRLSSRGYSTVFTSLTKVVAQGAEDIVASVRAALLANEAEVDRWPSDAEFEHAFRTFPLYENLTRPRIRFLLEAMEEAMRTSFAEEIRSPRGMTIEHVMPQGWREHWPLQEGLVEGDRDQIVQTIGNLTLLNGKFNPHQSNRPWIDGNDPDTGKRANLDAHTVLFLNRPLCQLSTWGEQQIEARSEILFNLAPGSGHDRWQPLDDPVASQLHYPNRSTAGRLGPRFPVGSGRA